MAGALLLTSGSAHSPPLVPPPSPPDLLSLNLTFSPHLPLSLPLLLNQHLHLHLTYTLQQHSNFRDLDIGNDFPRPSPPRERKTQSFVTETLKALEVDSGH